MTEYDYEIMTWSFRDQRKTDAAEMISLSPLAEHD
jgi:hypothetical protein